MFLMLLIVLPDCFSAANLQNKYTVNEQKTFILNYSKEYRKKEKNKYLLKKNMHLLGGLASFAAFAFLFFTPRRKDRKDRKKSQKPKSNYPDLIHTTTGIVD
jgi:hypothetical protein